VQKSETLNTLYVYIKLKDEESQAGNGTSLISP